MNSSLRFWGPASVASAVAIAAAGFLLGVQPALASAATDSDAASAAVTQQHVVEAKLARLSSVAAHQAELDARQAVLTKAVPSTLRANTFIRRVNELAALDGVKVTAIAPEQGVPYAPAETSAATPTSTAGASVVYGKSDPAITKSNLVVIPVTLTGSGTREALQGFTRDIGQDERLFAVTTYALAADESVPGGWSVTLTGSIYAVKV